MYEIILNCYRENQQYTGVIKPKEKLYKLREKSYKKYINTLKKNYAPLFEKNEKLGRLQMQKDKNEATVVELEEIKK